jgi:hypothetical protein
MSTRKDFLAAASLVAATSAAGTASAAETKLPFDLTAFNALLDGPQPHKHLFAACEIKGGEVLDMVRNTVNAYRDIGVPLTGVQPAVVLYHGPSIFLGLNDTFWNTYLGANAPKDVLPQLATIRKDGAQGNPALAQMTGLAADANTRFFICNNAAHGFSEMVGKVANVPAASVYADLTKSLVQNAQLVPAGIWAVHAIQEHRFTLAHTSLNYNA